MSERLTEKGTVAFDTILEQGEYDIVKQYLKLQQYEELAEQGRLITLEDGDEFTRCEDCIHGGWTDDVTPHCNYFTTEEHPRGVSYLNFCGAGTKGKSLELTEAEAQQALAKISGGENE